MASQTKFNRTLGQEITRDTISGGGGTDTRYYGLDIRMLTSIIVTNNIADNVTVSITNSLDASGDLTNANVLWADVGYESTVTGFYSSGDTRLITGVRIVATTPANDVNISIAQARER